MRYFGVMCGNLRYCEVLLGTLGTLGYFAVLQGTLRYCELLQGTSSFRYFLVLWGILSHVKVLSGTLGHLLALGVLLIHCDTFFSAPVLVVQFQCK